MSSRRLGLAVVVALCIAGIGAAQADTVGFTERVNLGPGNAQTIGGASFNSSISDNGRFVAFESTGTNLGANDTNETHDVFVRDRESNTTERVSVGPGGTQAVGGASSGPSISADGRFVAFESGATNLVDGDTNNLFDIFVRDREANTTERVNLDPEGAEATGGGSVNPSISTDGRFVAFESSATNLVPGDENAFDDVFVHDRETGITERVSVGPGGDEGVGGGSISSSISADGRFVAFHSHATNLVEDDINLTEDVFVRDRETGTTELVSAEPEGDEANGGNSFSPSISADGRFVAFASAAANLVEDDTNVVIDTFVHDRQEGATTRVSVGPAGAQATDGVSYNPSISADGRFVAFESNASDLVAGDSNSTLDIFVHDRQTNTTTRSSVGPDGAESTGGSFLPSISGDGRFVAFESVATNLVASDTNGLRDIFVRNRIGSPAPPSNNFKLAKPKLNKKKGTATIQLTLPGPGKAELLGNKKVKKSTKNVSTAGKAKLTIKAKGKTAKTLKKKGKVKLTLKFRFKPTGGQAKTITKKVTLKRKR